MEEEEGEGEGEEEDTRVIRSGKRFRHSRLKRCCRGQSFSPLEVSDVKGKHRVVIGKKETIRKKKKERKREKEVGYFIFDPPLKSFKETLTLVKGEHHH